MQIIKRLPCTWPVCVSFIIGYAMLSVMTCINNLPTTKLPINYPWPLRAENMVKVRDNPGVSIVSLRCSRGISGIYSALYSQLCMSRVIKLFMLLFFKTNFLKKIFQEPYQRVLPFVKVDSRQRKSTLASKEFRWISHALSTSKICMKKVNVWAILQSEMVLAYPDFSTWWPRNSWPS